MIHVVTDSTSDITMADAEALGVTVVPLIVRFGDEQFRDGVDLDADGFYAKLRHTHLHPTTSQPSPQLFSTVYRALLEDPEDHVISVHISSRLSGTLQSAHVAAKDVGSDRLHLIDSESVSAGLQLLVRAALDDVAAGDDAAAVSAKAMQRRRRVSILVLLDELTYLQRGGRIGRAQALLGSLLSVKPLLTVRDGEVAPLGRVRSREKGVHKILDELRARLPVRSVAIFHSAAPELVSGLKSSIEGVLPGAAVIEGRIGPVVGSYTGPGGIGVACLGAD